MTDRPQTDGAMFFVGMKFAPNESLKQSDLNRIVVELLSRVFVTRDGDALPIKHMDNPMLSLIQFLLDLDMRIDETTFEKFPPDLRKFFKVINRDGTEYRYGQRPRLV